MLLAVVAILAMAIEFTGIGPRWRRYRRAVAGAEVTVRSSRALMRGCVDQAARLRAAAKRAVPPEASRLNREADEAEWRGDEWRQLAEWNERMGEVYREASSHPWGPPPRKPPFVLRR
jgi:hypothetical protein